MMARVLTGSSKNAKLLKGKGVDKCLFQEKKLQGSLLMFYLIVGYHSTNGSLIFLTI
jgi:hypothetical protein